MKNPPVWRTHPQAESFVDELLATALRRTPAAAAFSTRLREVTGIRLRDILDHIGLDDPQWVTRARELGWAAGTERLSSQVATTSGQPHDQSAELLPEQIDIGVLSHSQGLFPDLLPGANGIEVGFRVESIERFAAAAGIVAEIEGPAFGPFRRVLAFDGTGARFWAIERNGHVTYEMPAISAAQIRSARLHLQTFRARRRQYGSVSEGLADTERLVDHVVADLGQHWACDIFLRAEREYWMQRCDAGRLQHQRQNVAGVGWCNIDHHTYDSSREYFSGTIRLFEKLGYRCRELFYAGAQAGWGSQVLEQPVLRSTIFADIDLSPEELDFDFAHLPLEPLPKLRRAGLWCAMHGESILQGGLNHVAGLYDQVALRAQLAREGIRMMAPFSERPELYQELTRGQWWPVSPAVIDQLQQAAHLTEEEAEDFRLYGAIATHLENIERNQGYKGFNQPGIDGVLRVIDPRKNLSSAPA